MGRLLLVAEGVHHLLAHGDADAEVESRAAVRGFGGGFDRVGGLELCVLLHVAEDSHGGPFVEGGLDVGREGNVFNEKLRQIETKALHVGLHTSANGIAKASVVGGEIEEWNAIRS